MNRLLKAELVKCVSVFSLRCGTSGGVMQNTKTVLVMEDQIYWGSLMRTGVHQAGCGGLIRSSGATMVFKQRRWHKDRLHVVDGTVQRGIRFYSDDTVEVVNVILASSLRNSQTCTSLNIQFCQLESKEPFALHSLHCVLSVVSTIGTF